MLFRFGVLGLDVLGIEFKRLATFEASEDVFLIFRHTSKCSGNVRLHLVTLNVS